jgi:hypothetical protein
MFWGGGGVSSLTIGHSCLTKPPVDYIAVGATIVLNNDYFTQFAIQDNGDHAEMVHAEGTVTKITSVMFDATKGGPMAAGALPNTLVYFDPNPIGTAQVDVVDGGVFIHDGTLAYALQIGGPGTIDFTIKNSVLQIGTSSYVSGAHAAGVNCHNGGGNYAYPSGVLINPCA